MFPSWFAGIGFSAIVIGALVPAPIMSIAAANLFTRNIYMEFFAPGASPAADQGGPVRLADREGRGAGVRARAEQAFSINLQLLGGVWVLQTFPAIVAGLYTRWFHRWALLIGWAAAMVYGTIQAWRVPTPGVPESHWGGSSAPVFGHVIYIAIAAFVLNVASRRC